MHYEEVYRSTCDRVQEHVIFSEDQTVPLPPRRPLCQWKARHLPIGWQCQVNNQLDPRPFGKGRLDLDSTNAVTGGDPR